MAINKKLIHFKTFENFNSQKLSANEENTKYTLGVDGEVLDGTPDILYQSIVCIKDVQKQWTHGQLYDGKDFSVVKITYEELKTLRDNSQLVPGQQYRIIDYVTTTIQENTQSAGHPFDVIVTADDESTLNEVARASLALDLEKYKDAYSNSWTEHMSYIGIYEYESKEYHLYESEAQDLQMLMDFNNPNFVNEYVGIDYPYSFWPTYGRIKEETWGEWLIGQEFSESINFKYNLAEYTYFFDSKLEAWQIWYCLDNDAERFAWADAKNGKGVIYRMIDEWNNDCPYDFKNIQFKRKLTDGILDAENGTDTWCYTFNAYHIDDTNIYDASVIACKVRLDDDANRCYGNNIKEYYEIANNTGLVLNDIVFLNTYSIGDNVYFHCYSNSFGNNCYSNSFGNNCYYNSFGNYCKSNLFGNYCRSNSFGNSCSENSFGDSCYGNSFGNSCIYNSFRSSSSETGTLKNYCDYNHFDDGCSYNVIWNSNTTSSSNSLKNINVNRGVSGTLSNYNFINIDTLDADYEIQVAKNSSGEIKIYNEADLIA